MIISKLFGNNSKQLVNNCSSVDFFSSVDCIESEWTDSPCFLLFLFSLLPLPPQRILCSTSALAMLEPWMGSCCRPVLFGWLSVCHQSQILETTGSSRSSRCDRSLSSKSRVLRRDSSNDAWAKASSCCALSSSYSRYPIPSSL